MLFLYASIATISLSSILVITTHNFDSQALAQQAGESVLWKHYLAVEPSLEKHGSREFWANCTVLGFVLEEPSSGTIEEGVSFDETPYFDELDKEDPRYVPSLAEQAEERAVKYATRPILSEDGKTVRYGLYPQTNVNDAELVAALNSLDTPEANGWYLYDDDYYAKLDSATPFANNYTFYNGDTIVNGSAYWFKCEPITWNVLSSSYGQKYVLSSVLLDAQCFYASSSNRKIGGATIYPCNYEYSDIRAWLNGDFYDMAFSLGDSDIKETTVYNDAGTTDSYSNGYVCNDTNDKVYLPSYKDYVNASYGFSTSASVSDTRYCVTTDWARARGASYDVSGEYINNGKYWTRSPSSQNNTYSTQNHVWLVNEFGYLIDYPLASAASYCARPAITIKTAS